MSLELVGSVLGFFVSVLGFVVSVPSVAVFVLGFVIFVLSFVAFVLDIVVPVLGFVVSLLGFVVTIAVFVFFVLGFVVSAPQMPRQRITPGSSLDRFRASAKSLLRSRQDPDFEHFGLGRQMAPGPWEGSF